MNILGRCLNFIKNIEFITLVTPLKIIKLNKKNPTKSCYPQSLAIFWAELLTRTYPQLFQVPIANNKKK